MTDKIEFSTIQYKSLIMRTGDVLGETEFKKPENKDLYKENVGLRNGLDIFELQSLDKDGDGNITEDEFASKFPSQGNIYKPYWFVYLKAFNNAMDTQTSTSSTSDTIKKSSDGKTLTLFDNNQGYSQGQIKAIVSKAMPTETITYGGNKYSSKKDIESISEFSSTLSALKINNLTEAQKKTVFDSLASFTNRTLVFYTELNDLFSDWNVNLNLYLKEALEINLPGLSRYNYLKYSEAKANSSTNPTQFANMKTQVLDELKRALEKSGVAIPFKQNEQGRYVDDDDKVLQLYEKIFKDKEFSINDKAIASFIAYLDLQDNQNYSGDSFKDTYLDGLIKTKNINTAIAKLPNELNTVRNIYYNPMTTYYNSINTTVVNEKKEIADSKTKEKTDFVNEIDEEIKSITNKYNIMIEYYTLELDMLKMKNDNTSNYYLYCKEKLEEAQATQKKKIDAKENEKYAGTKSVLEYSKDVIIANYELSLAKQGQSFEQTYNFTNLISKLKDLYKANYQKDSIDLNSDKIENIKNEIKTLSDKGYPRAIINNIKNMTISYIEELVKKTESNKTNTDDSSARKLENEIEQINSNVKNALNVDVYDNISDSRELDRFFSITNTLEVSVRNDLDTIAARYCSNLSDVNKTTLINRINELFAEDEDKKTELLKIVDRLAYFKDIAAQTYNTLYDELKNKGKLSILHDYLDGSKTKAQLGAAIGYVKKDNKEDKTEAEIAYENLRFSEIKENEEAKLTTALEEYSKTTTKKNLTEEKLKELKKEINEL